VIILTIRTDKPEAELRLFEGQTQLAEIVWQAHRELAETIHLKIKELLDSQQKQLQEIEGVVVFQGPGSFTGLRIGLSVANALADSLSVPIVGTQTDGWQNLGIIRLQNHENDTTVLPEYGAPVNITAQKK
jgi:tRNA threonylcarbamoyladenosine biosynthesis protein TsaB